MASQGTGAKRALITGAGGFTGRYLARELRQHGWEVWGLGHTPAAAFPAAELHHYVQTELNDYAPLQAAVLQAAPQAVFHLAAIAFVGHGSPADFYRVNVGGSRNLLQALAGLPTAPQSVLLASSANVYGNAAEGQLAESTPLRPANDYAVSKAAMEMMASLWVDRLPLAVARPFNYTGLDQSTDFLIPKIVDHFRRKAPMIELGNLHVWRDFSDVRDVVRAYRLLAEKPVAGAVVNVGSQALHSLQDVLDLCARLTGHAMEVRVNPAFVRANEVKTLRADTSRLDALIGERSLVPLEQTLQWMLAP
ncbi:NAD-dependent epimerase/dehydratase family protein [Acidovorax sp. SDU_ACID1]|uniref:NAD-dependent epimerase/dehydratase family protein n=1 Tax=Acidovorax sp. SDU_ACID1 TaxID=3136632 RepID=UPI003872CB8E